MEIGPEPIELPSIMRPRGGRLRLWYGQPHLRFLRDGPPWRCDYSDQSATAVDLLDAIVTAELTLEPTGSPTLILLPEYSVRFADLRRAQDAIGRLRPNSLVVFGMEQLSDGQALSIENEPSLWDGAAEGRFTNCAVVGEGSTGRLFVQPKALPSHLETTRFWAGRKVRYFRGRGLSWIVQICSDLLMRPEEATTAAAIVDWLRERSYLLSLVVWIQHNEKPRSVDFWASIEAYCRHGATVLAVASRPPTRGRFENYGVSGALVANEVLPRHFHLLSKEFHYIEPVNEVASRAVLLRYDAEIYRATTVLADSVQDVGGPEKGEIFAESQPFRFLRGALEPSNEHNHLEDISGDAIARTRLAPAPIHVHINTIAQRILALSTRDFLAFLDLALLPRPVGGVVHVAGDLHDQSDLQCRCWDHRCCIDYLQSERGKASSDGFAEVLTALGALISQGVDLVPAVGIWNRTYLETVAQTGRFLAVVYPFNVDAREARNRLQRRARPPLIEVGYIVLGTGGTARLLLSEIDAARAKPVGMMGAATAEGPEMRIAFSEKFAAALGAGQLASFVDELFGGSN